MIFTNANQVSELDDNSLNPRVDNYNPGRFIRGIYYPADFPNLAEIVDMDKKIKDLEKVLVGINAEIGSIEGHLRDPGLWDEEAIEESKKELPKLKNSCEILRYKHSKLEQKYDAFIADHGVTRNANKTFKFDRPITEQDVNDLRTYCENLSKNNYLNGFGVTIVLQNTKDQDPEIISSLQDITMLNKCPINFSVLGGLDYLNNPKYDKGDYKARTVYTPDVIANIIKEYEKIESHIEDNWTDMQKAIYVYCAFIKLFHYKTNDEVNIIQDRQLDVSRGLSGMLAQRGVCAGFALMYKEAMDRLGVGCLYQNTPSVHSWNVLQIDGKNLGIDVTWDISLHDKNPNADPFNNFASLDSNAFYGQGSHNTDEARCDLTVMSREEIKENYEVIKDALRAINHTQKNYRSIAGDSIYSEQDVNLGTVIPLNPNDENGVKYQIIENINNKDYITVFARYLDTDGKFRNTIVYVDRGMPLESALTVENLQNVGKSNNAYIGKNHESIIRKKYIREDNSSVILTEVPEVKTDSTIMERMKRYSVYEFRNDKMNVYKVLSESKDLAIKDNANEENLIANNLLSHENLTNRINYYGYLGHLEGDKIVTIKGLEDDIAPFINKGHYGFDKTFIDSGFDEFLK